MAFNTLEFMLLLAASVAVYYIVPQKWRNAVLLVVSYIFYAYYSIPLVLFLLLCTLFAFFVAKQLEIAEGEKKKKWLGIGIGLEVLALAFYKYTNFLLELILGGDTTVRLSVVVPLGISFIVFTVISYLIDVYRGTVAAEKRLDRFALYMAFFPKVTQGPITKYKDFAPQMENPPAYNQLSFRAGLLMVLYGMAVKMVIADRLAVPVNMIYGNLEVYSGTAIAFASILFAIQIYFDFAGYSLVAIGAARLFGFELKDNFRQPYLSTSVGEFWRRWHISLNQWLVDYIYIPLGGSRCKPVRRDLNTLITFGVSGLWHGADMGYVIWGLLNGLYVVVERRLDSFRKRRNPEYTGQKSTSTFAMIGTFVLVTFAWIFFRAQELPAAMTAVTRIFTKLNFGSSVSWMVGKLTAKEPFLYGLTGQSWKVLIIALLVSWVVDLACQKCRVSDKIASAKFPVRWLVYLVLIFAVILYGMYGYGYSAGAFIYAQF